MVHYIYEADFSKTHNEKPGKLASTHKAFFLLGTKIAMNLEWDKYKWNHFTILFTLCIVSQMCWDNKVSQVELTHSKA